MDKLIPCPFCGNKDVHLNIEPWSGFWFVECNVYACNRTSVPMFETKEEAIEAWNKGERDDG